ncbi:uncharacterized protein LOC116349362 [Contarinia nasturtii]|uniref:uncharacterized protein LOC116349362 n=1 Tax=Contarinia nasturtii TaxID=265458 RepID=UPI0012D38A47|nr:uncharacterized protein LOC116349362 [Contarinia nasturtii]
MADSSEPAEKRLRRGRSANKATKAVVSEETSKSQPKTDAPKKESSNSMLCLNDDCLQKLFEHLDINSLCQMANVCKRFRPITMQVFSHCHKKFVFKALRCKNSDFRRALCKFGHLMTSINASEANLGNYDERLDGNAIVKYCTNNLEELIVRQATIDCDAFKPLFSRLKCINLIECEFTGNKTDLFKSCPNLEILSFHADFLGSDMIDLGYDELLSSIDFVVRKFPKLKRLGFDCSYDAHLKLFNLLALNPQVKEIDVIANPEDVFIDGIVKNAKNLEVLKLRCSDSGPEVETRKGFLKLSKLKKLQKLYFEAGSEEYGKFFGPLMDAFAKEKVPIGQLEMFNFNIRPKDIKSILKLKTMKILSLNSIEKASDADLVPLATQLQLLEHLQLDFTNVKAPITANGLVNMAADGNQLEYMALINVQNLKIDQKVFENILQAVQSRSNGKKLTIDIVGSYDKTTSFNVPGEIQRAANAHLIINYSTLEDE